ncbi:MAG: hypothetical protein ABEJ89_01240 [Haloarculaceae archaeon]
MKVALALPELSTRPGTLSLEARGDVRGFERAGHDVTLYYDTDRQRLAADADGYDLVVLTSLATTVETGDAHLHHQIGGYGPQEMDPRLVANTFANADTVSMLDPAIANKAPWFQAIDADPDEVAVIPSPPNPDLFPAQPREASDGTVLIPNLGDEYAPDGRCARIVRHTPTITYRAHASGVSHALPSNVQRFPPVPVSAAPDRYAGAELVFNPAQAAALPDACYRAFCSERAYVSAPEAIGGLQSLPAEVIDTAAFGESVAWWRDTYRASYFEGDHYAVADAQSLPDVLSTLMEDRQQRWELAERGREWIESVFDGWGWREKAEALVALAEAV